MDLENPAVTKLLSVPPAVLEEIKDDPKAIRDTARVMLMIQLDALHRKLAAQDAPTGQKQVFAEFLAKLGDVFPKPNAQTTQGPGFSVQIVLAPPKNDAPVYNPLLERVDEAPTITIDMPEAPETAKTEPAAE